MIWVALQCTFSVGILWLTLETYGQLQILNFFSLNFICFNTIFHLSRPVIGDDHGFKPLKEVTEEKEKEKEPKLTHVEKRNSQRYSYHGNPEDAIPLLELHIQDGRPPVLNSNDETQEAQPEQPAVKPLLDVCGDGNGNTTMSSGKSKEKIWPHVV